MAEGSMSEMVERVAEVIASTLAASPGDWHGAAHNAIIAMQEPTDSMDTAGNEYICAALENGCIATVSDVYRAMVGTALDPVASPDPAPAQA